MKKKLLYAFAFVLTLGLLTACNKPSEPAGNAVQDKPGTETSLTITHELGSTTVPRHPKKVAVFDMGVLDIMNEIGADRAGGRPERCHHLLVVQIQKQDQYRRDQGTGSGRTLQLQAGHHFHQRTAESLLLELSKIAPTVYIQIEPGRYMADLEKNVTDVGRIFGKEDVAARKMDDLKKQIANARAVAANSNDKALILLTNDGSMSAYGKGSRFGLIHDVLGIREADENIKVSSPTARKSAMNTSPKSIPTSSTSWTERLS